MDTSKADFTGDMNWTVTTTQPCCKQRRPWYQKGAAVWALVNYVAALIIFLIGVAQSGISHPGALAMGLMAFALFGSAIAMAEDR